MSEFYEPIWITYAHLILFLVFILISLPTCHLLHYALSKYCPCTASECPCFKSKLVKQFEEQSTTGKTAPAGSTAEKSISGTETVTSSTVTSTAKVKASKGRHKRDTFPTGLRITLVISILISFLFVALQTFFVPFVLRMGGIHLSFWMCRYLGFVLVLVFVSGRMMINIFFVLRAYYSFKSSKTLRYDVRVITVVVVVMVCVSATTAIPIMILMETELKPSIAYNNIGERCFRIPKEEDSKGPFYINLGYMFGTLSDVTMQFVSLYLLLSKLFAHIRRSRKLRGDNGELKKTDVYFMLLATRLSILFLIIVVTSQMTLVLFMMVPLLNPILYSIDNMINVYCLWLSFSMNDNVYKKYFCGEQLTKVCFPFISSVAVCCDEERNCHCCCCCVCCTCDAKKKEYHKELLANAKIEIELILVQKDDKDDGSA
eukprot:194362_1